MTMPQLSAIEAVSDFRSFTMARMEVELEQALRGYEERLLATPEPDDIAMAIHRRTRQAHDETLAALSRVRRGTFGICETCQGLISEARLEAMPQTRYCATCAQRAAKEL